MKPPSFQAVAGTALLAASALVAAPLPAPTQPESEAARGRYELSDGRATHVGGTVRRPAVVIGAGPALALAVARDNRLAPADGRLELRFGAQPNGAVTGVRMTQRPLRDPPAAAAAGDQPLSWR
jgi:hypothetical protein